MSGEDEVEVENSNYEPPPHGLLLTKNGATCSNREPKKQQAQAVAKHRIEKDRAVDVAAASRIEAAEGEISEGHRAKIERRFYGKSDKFRARRTKPSASDTSSYVGLAVEEDHARACCPGI
ncbi:hypothetical protein PRK78_005426 [Emydomyces testavorans]|uniref:Uncharacterized protein n=1 Tax=Emydomyces testavorans TaxID=2070801 RepID=A0AAF0DKI7_9EURO|nr:hypothetical protein PRK78_005426 [Emydomyces testavorans]